MRVVSQLLGNKGVIIVLAVGLTIASLQFVRPINCQRVCMEPTQAPCPDGACRFGEQRAGFPFPMVQDADPDLPTGSGSIGTLGEEDYFYFNVFAFGGNVLFYAAIFWLLGRFPRALRSATARHEWVRLLPALVCVGAGLLIGFLNYRPPAAWHPPATTAPPAVALLGTWRATEPVSGAPIFVRFYDTQQVVWSPVHNEPVIGGDYRWVDDRTIQVHFGDYLPSTIDMCARLPTLFVRACRAQLATPTATIRPVQAQAVDANASPTPTLNPEGTVVSMIEVQVMATVTVDQTTLTLQPRSGRAQTFQRVTGE